MNRPMRIIWVVAALLTWLPYLVAQSPHAKSGKKGKRGSKETELALEISQFPSTHADSSELRMYARIDMNQLVFVRHGAAFRAAYEVSVFALDEDEKVRATSIWQEEVILENFPDTKSKDIVANPSTSLSLNPGDYTIEVHITDLGNRHRYSATEEVTVKRYPVDSLVISDILLVSKAKASGPVDIIPQIGGRISDDVDSFYVYLVIRNPLGGPVRAVREYSLRNSKGELAIGDSSTIALGADLTTHLIPIATNVLVDREYTLEVKVSVQDLLVTQTITVTLEWVGISRMIQDLEKAIDQTRYLAKRKELKAMQAAESEELRQELFKKFWEIRDPSPGTPRNELMDEYYRRVAYSNQHFRSYQDGWESDLGMVFIIYGPPDDIERHPFDAQRKPYQIWQYYDKGWRFVFVDVNMFGDYRLVTTLYPTGR